MNLLSGNNFLYSSLSKVNTYFRYCFTILFICLLAIGWFVLFYQKLTDEIVQISNDIVQLKKKEELISNLKREIKDVEINTNYLNNKLENALNLKIEEINNNIDSIIQCANSSDLLILYCSAEEKINKLLYSKSLISFNIKGNFFQLIEFLKKLSVLKKLIKCKKITVNRISELELQIDCVYKFYGSNIGCMKWSDSFYAY